jgi:hypothetical protein
VIRKCVQFCTDRQTIDSNVTGRKFIVYWIIKSTGTNSRNIPFNPFIFAGIITRTSLSVALQVHYVSFLVFIVLFVCGGEMCVLLRDFNRCLNFVIM